MKYKVTVPTLDFKENRVTHNPLQHPSHLKRVEQKRTWRAHSLLLLSWMTSNPQLFSCF